MIKILIILVLISQIVPMSAQKENRDELILAYFNLDNLFDTKDDQTVLDDDYTAIGRKNWTEERYENKIENIVEILAGGIDGDLPELLVFSEVENMDILNDIGGHRKIRKSRYDILFNEDLPGLALLSKEGIISDIGVREITNSLLPSDSSANSSVIYIKCRLNDGQKYHLFINSWTARTGGTGLSESERMGLAASVRREIDKVLNFERDARIIILGTFNDEPTGRSIMMMLNATNKKKNLGDRDLYNLFYDMHNEEDKGTVIINGIWQMYDFIIVSPSLLRSRDGYFLSYRDAHIADIKAPMFGPTYRGDEYLGGVSDHLPVYIVLKRSTGQ
ncbi:MAG TPA: hypothetical protein VMW76_09755 [Bacteroidales bacterium]|nr:hypothetical protein [Bacteroidales bacterium]